jgi:hypothetical protein
MKGILTAALLVFSSSAANAQAAIMNDLIENVVGDFRMHRAGGGYDMSAYFTQKLQYGDHCCILPKNPRATMCVAGVAEIIVETLNLYSKNHNNDKTAFGKLPMSSWTKGTLTSIRANLFMYDGTGSRGTGYTLERLGLGKEKTFAELKPYDFVNFNRTGGSGHAAVFISFLDSNSKETTTYSPNVIGFHYFSAQGKGKPDAGFADRYAYFDGKCPATQMGAPRDCGVIRSANKSLLDAGELWEPSKWKTEEAISAITSAARGILDKRYPGQAKGFLDDKLSKELDKELTPNVVDFTGETTD